eukprot:gene3949-4932_t
MSGSNIRCCSHAGSWYEKNSKKLNDQLNGWLSQVQPLPNNTRAIIAPHAGYTYSGRAASYGYINLIPDKQYKRIFILGPSHHVYLQSCGLTKLDYFETPLGNLQVDKEITKELFDTGKFVWNTKKIDEDEHSLEMHLPYIARLYSDKLEEIKIVPIMVGHLNVELEKMYGELLYKYFDDPTNFFVISSDFCHWGERFDYTRYDKSLGEIHESIEHLDKRGMKMIETGDPLQFSQYLKETKNTICGRCPIAVMMWISKLSKSHPNITINSVYYEQSSHCKSMRDSSLWDTAGQEKFWCLTEVFWRSADAVVLVYDVSNEKSFKNLDFWYKQFKSKSLEGSEKNLPVMVLGNKVDCNKVVKDVEVEQWCKEHNISLFFEVSAKQSKLIKESIIKLIEVILEQEKDSENSHYDEVSSDVGQTSESHLLKSKRSPHRVCNSCCK